MGRIYTLLVVKVSMHMLVNPWSFVIHTHGNELHQIPGALHGVNPSLIDVCLHGKDLRTSCCESFYAYACDSLVLSFVIHMGMNYVKFEGHLTV